jgi:hypothetical protein
MFNYSVVAYECDSQNEIGIKKKQPPIVSIVRGYDVDASVGVLTHFHL